MISDKVTPQILKCAEAIRFYFENGQDAPENPEVSMIENDKRVNNDIATLIMEHTGAEELPKCYHNLNLMKQIAKTLEVCVIELRAAFSDSLKFTKSIKILQEVQDKLTIFLSRLGEFGYGKE